MNIIIVPKGKGSEKNYKKTIINAVSIKGIGALSNDKSFVWGINIGTRGDKKFSGISKKDLVLFVTNNKKDGDSILKAFIVEETFISEEASLKFWNTTKYKKILILSDTTYNSRDSKMSYTHLAKMIGYEKTRPSNSAVIIPNKKRILEQIEIFNIYKKIIGNNSFNINENKLSIDIDGKNIQLTQKQVTDAYRMVKVRLEQRELRDKLINGRETAECAICNVEYPVTFLHAGHIKKRGDSDTSERNNINIATLMCIFGCDALFENKYIYISEDGKVHKKFSSESMLKVINDYVEKLEKNSKVDVNIENIEFYKWHKDQDNKLN